jgi:hypothetical protein
VRPHAQDPDRSFCLEEAGDRLPSDLDRHALAQLVLSTMEGGVMQARTHRELKPFDAGVKLLRDYFDRLAADAALVEGAAGPSRR